MDHLTLSPVYSRQPSDAYMRRRTRPSLVQIMACRLFGAKPLSEPMLMYFYWTIWNNFQCNVNHNSTNFIHENEFENARWLLFCLGISRLMCWSRIFILGFRVFIQHAVWNLTLELIYWKHGFIFRIGTPHTNGPNIIILSTLTITITITTITITIILLPYTIHEDNSSDVEKHNWPKSTFEEVVLKKIRVKIKTRIEVYVMIHRISNIANHKQHIFLHMAKREQKL